ncbi:MAG: LysM peptidoglycan-binding domain-containing protein, partial [Anaerolineae bacterium]|nr:LysM peptidoglycan-binding domain-containing protein [Anaerolineae bacterium]
GHTLSTLAESYGASMNDIRVANDMPPDAESIRIGEVLQIPQYTPTPELTPEVVEANAPAQGPSYSPPTLLYPPDGATFTGAETQILLQWASVGILDLEAGEFYRVEFTAVTSEGPVTTYAYVRATTWRVPQELFPVPELANRTCSWQISIVRRQPAPSEIPDIIITLPGSRRSFTWNPETP